MRLQFCRWLTSGIRCARVSGAAWSQTTQAANKSFAGAIGMAAAGAFACATMSPKRHMAEEDLAHLTDNERGSVTLMDDLIGPMGHLRCSKGFVKVRGLDVAYWKYENPKFDGLHLPPVVALHGGPGFTHNYILPLQLLADMGYPVIFYDQAGCGASTFVEKVKESAPWLLTIDYYVKELYAVLDHFSLQEAASGYFVFGSSWGTILAQEFAVTQPAGLKGLILDGALCDGQLYIKTQWRDRISQMPSLTQKTLKRLEDEEAYDTKLYAAIEDRLSTHFTYRQVPTPACFLKCIRTQNKEIYVGMQGHSEFTLGGVLKNWSITDRLGDVTVPTLVVVGEYDTMTDECSQLIVDSLPAAWPLVKIPRAAHCKLLDEPKLCCDAIYKFVFSVEQGGRKQ